MISIGVSSYNFRAHVASDVPVNGMFIPTENLKTQEYLNKIACWTDENKMKLNNKKSKAMVFNYTNNYQFSSRVYIEDELIEIIKETKLLGVIISDDLTWDLNTAHLVKKANSRMCLLNKLVEFGVPENDLIQIYVLYIRSILEQSCPVWHSSLTAENSSDLERVQKNALKIILKSDYIDYSQALQKAGLSSLSSRRDQLCLKFAKSCLKSEATKDIFPLNTTVTNAVTRKKETFKVTPSTTERLKKSAIPCMQRMLNANPL